MDSEKFHLLTFVGKILTDLPIGAHPLSPIPISTRLPSPKSLGTGSRPLRPMTAMCPISGAANHVDAEVRAQRFGHHHAAVGLLVVFKDRQPGAPNREPAAVDGVHEVGFTAAGFSLDRRAPRLVRLEIGARRNLLVSALAGEPDLDVIGLGRTRAHIAGA